MADEELIRKIRDGSWKNPELRGADLRDAGLRRANLAGANLQEAVLVWADLQKADLQRTNLQYANLYGAGLQQTDLRMANLQKAYLHGTNLQDADLYGAGLQGAQVDGKTKIELPDEYYIDGDIIRWRHDQKTVKDGGPIADERIEDTAPMASTDREPAPTLSAHPEDRILTSTSMPLAGKTLVLRNESLEKLTTLRESLNSIHGSDEEFKNIPNTERVPMTGDELVVLRQTVDAAIALHNMPNFPPEVVGAMKKLQLYLKSKAEEWKKLYETEAAVLGQSKIMQFGTVIGALGLAALGVEALINVLGG